MINQQVLQKLQQFDTPTICNLIELFDVRPRNVGYMDARIVAAFPEMPPIVGFAATATFRSGAPPRQGDAYGDLNQQVERFRRASPGRRSSSSRTWTTRRWPRPLAR